ncbi:MAG: hypothetical protein RIT81_09175 [Deltaproteobacteria bacterium]
MRFVQVGLVVLAVGCADTVPQVEQLAVEPAAVTAGEAVTVTWSTDGESIDLVDDADRPLQLAGPASGSVEVVMYRTSTLRLVARGADADAEATAAVTVTPRLEADVLVRRYEAGSTDYTVRWDSLGATSWALTYGGAAVTGLPQTDGGTFDGTATGALELVASAGEPSARVSLAVPILADEAEPNDAVGASTPVGAGVVGTLDVGDVDVFALDVPAGGHVRAVLRDRDDACSVAGTLRLVAANGDRIAVQGGATGCPELSPSAAGNGDLAAGTYFLVLSGVRPSSYALFAEAIAPACGNGVVESRVGELCEPGEGACRDDCTIDATEEVEPNDASGDAQDIVLGTPVVARADAPRDRDVDWYAFTLDAETAVDVRVTGPGLSGCQFALEGISLRSSRGAVIEDAPIDQQGRWCGRIRTDALAPGRYLVRVSLVDFLGPDIPRYFLRVDAGPAPACGDGEVFGDEACDDGNVQDGDGCDANCAYEVADRITPRLEPYTVTGGPLEPGEAFVLELDVDGPTRLSFDTFVPQLGVCEGNADLRVRLDGTIVADDSGLGRCAAGDFLVQAAGAEIHRLRVEPIPGQRVDAFVMVLRLSAPEPTCGDLFLSPSAGESCDDGGRVSGDGCSDTCRVEPKDVPPITAATTLTVDDLPVQGQSVAYPLSVDAIDTQLTITPQPGPTGFCPEQYDVTVHDAAFDFVGGNLINRQGNCAPARARARVAGTHYLAVRNDGRTSVTGLDLAIELTAPACGDGVFTASAGEACDDGNTAVGDGCDDTCAVEAGYLAEVEPNDDAATATPLLVRTSSVGTDDVSIATNQRSFEDVDFFVVENASGADMWLEVTISAQGDCGDNQDLQLFDDNGALVAEDLVGQLVQCQLLNPIENPEVAALPPGRYVLSVDGSLLSTYFVRVRAGSGVFP